MIIKLGTLMLNGRSGQTYAFTVFSYDAEFSAVGAVYGITRRQIKPDGHYKHTAIYIGETSALSTRLDGHHKESCFTEHNANCKCIHLDKNDDSRRKKEADLIDNYNPPCND